jgi:endoglucanase
MASWGSTDEEVPEVVEPVHELIAREFPSWSPYPWSARATADDVIRHILFAQAMLTEYAERFRGLSDDALDALADSFAHARCATRTRLCELLASRIGTAAGQA